MHGGREFEGVDRFEPYFVRAAGLDPRLEHSPLGLDVPDASIFDPMRCASASFLDRIEDLDRATFGQQGLGMPRWALYDCAELPGLICGFGAQAETLPDEVTRHFEVARGFVPVSMFIAIPTLAAGHWLGHSLCGLLDERVAWSSVVLGLEALRAERMTVTTQWHSPNLDVYARFAPLRVRAAWLPAHDEPGTGVFEFPAHAVPPVGLTEALDDRGPFDTTDTRVLRTLQDRLERGAQIFLDGRSGAYQLREAQQTGAGPHEVQP